MALKSRFEMMVYIDAQLVRRRQKSCFRHLIIGHFSEFYAIQFLALFIGRLKTVIFLAIFPETL